MFKKISVLSILFLGLLVTNQACAQISFAKKFFIGTGIVGVVGYGICKLVDYVTYEDDELFIENSNVLLNQIENRYRQEIETLDVGILDEVLPQDLELLASDIMSNRKASDYCYELRNNLDQVEKRLERAKVGYQQPNLNKANRIQEWSACVKRLVRVSGLLNELNYLLPQAYLELQAKIGVLKNKYAGQLHVLTMHNCIDAKKNLIKAILLQTQLDRNSQYPIVHYINHLQDDLTQLQKYIKNYLDLNITYIAPQSVDELVFNLDYMQRLIMQDPRYVEQKKIYDEERVWRERNAAFTRQQQQMAVDQARIKLKYKYSAS